MSAFPLSQQSAAFNAGYVDGRKAYCTHQEYDVALQRTHPGRELDEEYEAGFEAGYYEGKWGARPCVKGQFDAAALFDGHFAAALFDGADDEQGDDDDAYLDGVMEAASELKRRHGWGAVTEDDSKILAANGLNLLDQVVVQDDPEVNTVIGAAMIRGAPYALVLRGVATSYEPVSSLKKVSS